MPVAVELATHQLNQRRLRSLGNGTPCQVYHDPARRLQLHEASRQRIFREVFGQFWHYMDRVIRHLLHRPPDPRLRKLLPRQRLHSVQILAAY